jgi:hypothetical protein
MGWGGRYPRQIPLVPTKQYHAEAENISEAETYDWVSHIRVRVCEESIDLIIFFSFFFWLKA